jgi:hypothetical protein
VAQVILDGYTAPTRSLDRAKRTTHEELEPGSPFMHLAECLVRNGHATYAVVRDPDGLVVYAYGALPWQPLEGLGIGDRFKVRGRDFTYRAGGPGGCYSSYIYVPHKHGMFVEVPVFNGRGRPGLVKINPLDTVTLLPPESGPASG